MRALEFLRMSMIPLSFPVLGPSPGPDVKE